MDRRLTGCLQRVKWQALAVVVTTDTTRLRGRSLAGVSSLVVPLAAVSERAGALPLLAFGQFTPKYFVQDEAGGWCPWQRTGRTWAFHKRMLR